MKKLLLVMFLLSGCANMTPEGKRTAWIVTGIVVAGVIISSSNSGSDSPEPCQVSFVVLGDRQSQGNTRICN